MKAWTKQIISSNIMYRLRAELSAASRREWKAPHTAIEANSLRIMCPAVIFAASRKARAIGRIMDLRSSDKTIRGAK